MKLAALAVFTTFSFGALTGVVTVLLQPSSAGQVASPPPVTDAVLVTLAAAAAVGVTGMTKLLVPLVAGRPAAMVQVTVWPEAVQPGGNVPMVRPVGMVSVTVATAVVAAVPVLSTFKV